MKLSQPPESLSQNREDLIEKDAILLRRTAERLVRLGQQIGVTSEEMISLLDSGITIRDLLAFLASKDSGVRLDWQCNSHAHGCSLLVLPPPRRHLDTRWLATKKGLCRDDRTVFLPLTYRLSFVFGRTRIGNFLLYLHELGALALIVRKNVQSHGFA